jgi:hypothetical protein
VTGRGDLERAARERQSDAAEAPADATAHPDAGASAISVELVCERCGGRRVAGRFALPLLGSAKFGVRLGALAVETDIASDVCLECGRVELGVVDLERIKKAIHADEVVKQAERRAHR